MSFSTQQKINMFTKALVAGVIDGESISAWYESFFPFTFIMDSAQVWLQLDLLKQYPATTLVQAQTNAAGDLSGVVEDRSTSPLRLTQMFGSNGTTYVAHTTYDDRTSVVLKNWLLPQLIPTSTGSPSSGYGILLYDGDPNAGGTLISTTTGQTGSGETASQAWIWNYANGLLFVAPDFTITDPYIVGFRYVGKTVTDLATEVADNTADIAVNSTNIATNTTNITTNTDSITNNTSGVASNTSNISSNTSSISANASSISTNATSINSTNAAVASNATNITTNTASVSGLSTRVDELETSSGTTGLITRFIK